MQPTVKALPSAATAFRDSVRKQNFESLRLEAWLGIVLIPIFGVLDTYVLPDHLYVTWALRATTTGFAAVVAVMARLRPRFVERHVDGIGFILTLCVCASIAAMCWLDSGYESPYYAGLSLVMTSVGLLFIWPFWFALTFQLSAYFVYMFPLVLGVLGVGDMTIVLGNQLFLLSFMLLAVSAQVVRYRLTLREFETQRSIRAARDQLEDAVEKLKEVDRLKSQFFNNITHELRTPLTMILAPLETVLGSAGVSAATRKYLDGIWASALKLLKLINDLLDLAKMGEKFLRLRIKQDSLVGLLTELVEHAQPLAARKDVRLSLEVVEEPADVHADAEKMERVFVNLLSNALKFTPEGGAVTVRVWLEGQQVCYGVRDTGMGIPPDKLEAIFERFTQADATVTRKFGGTGIGLAFAREIVDLHGGEITVDSVLDEGSEFVVRLKQGMDHFDPMLIDRRKDDSKVVGKPRRAEDAEPAEWSRRLVQRADYRFMDLEDATERRVLADRDDAGKTTKVLVVEDNPQIIRFVSTLLAEEHAVYTATNGREGLELAIREQPDLVVTDYMMPEMDGVTLIGHLRERPETKDTPIIMLTAKNAVEDRWTARQRGADVYINKPFSPQELTEAVRRELAKRGQQVRTLLKAQTSSLEIVSAGLAHEIQNPLNYIKNAVEVLHDTVRQLGPLLRNQSGDPDAVAGKLAKAEARIEKMGAVVGKGVVRIEQVVALIRRYAREGYPSEPSWMPFDAAVEDVIALVGPKDLVEVPLDVALGAPGAVVRCIPEEMHQVIRNLVQNAIDVVGAGGHVAVRTVLEGDELIFQVTDDGPGIPPDDLKRVFTPFFTTKAAGQGMGLGLAISRQVVDDAGGRIEVSTRLGHGTTMRVHLPALSAGGEAAQGGG